MTNLDIDKALALAIGWKPEQIQKRWGGIAMWVDDADEPQWVQFDHTDPAVIWPIAERFDLFPRRYKKLWLAVRFMERTLAVHPCAATAVALAVIEANK